MNTSLTIIEAALKLAGKLPGDVIEQVAQIISAHDAVDARSRIADSIPHPHHRSLCLKFFNDFGFGFWIRDFGLRLTYE